VSSAARPWTYDVRPGVSANVAEDYKIKSAVGGSWTFWDLYQKCAEEFSVFWNVGFGAMSENVYLYGVLRI
jgi:hypothetical protein